VSLEVQGNGSSEGKGSLGWRERKRFLKDKLAELAAEIVTDSEKLKAFAERWRGGFRAYSLYNLALIWAQRPSATLCAGYHGWHKHGRHVKAGEKALWILAPAIFPVKGKRSRCAIGDKDFMLKFYGIDKSAGVGVLVCLGSVPGDIQARAVGREALAYIAAHVPKRNGGGSHPLKKTGSLADGKTSCFSDYQSKSDGS